MPGRWNLLLTLTAVSLQAVASRSPNTTNVPCSACLPGTYVSALCTSDVDTLCAPCEENSFTADYNSLSKCFACSKCAPGTFISQACSRTTDTVCSSCAQHDLLGSKYDVTACGDVSGSDKLNGNRVGDVTSVHDIMMGDDDESLGVTEGGVIQKMEEKERQKGEEKGQEDENTSPPTAVAVSRGNDEGGHENENDKEAIDPAEYNYVKNDADANVDSAERHSENQLRGRGDVGDSKGEEGNRDLNLVAIDEPELFEVEEVTINFDKDMGTTVHDIMMGDDDESLGVTEGGVIQKMEEKERQKGEEKGQEDENTSPPTAVAVSRGNDEGGHENENDKEAIDPAEYNSVKNDADANIDSAERHSENQLKGRGDVSDSMGEEGNKDLNLVAIDEPELFEVEEVTINLSDKDMGTTPTWVDNAETNVKETDETVGDYLSEEHRVGGEQAVRTPDTVPVLRDVPEETESVEAMVAQPSEQGVVDSGQGKDDIDDDIQSTPPVNDIIGEDKEKDDNDHILREVVTMVDSNREGAIKNKQEEEKTEEDNITDKEDEESNENVFDDDDDSNLEKKEEDNGSVDSHVNPEKEDASDTEDNSITTGGVYNDATIKADIDEKQVKPDSPRSLTVTSPLPDNEGDTKLDVHEGKTESYINSVDKAEEPAHIPSFDTTDTNEMSSAVDMDREDDELNIETVELEVDNNGMNVADEYSETKPTMGFEMVKITEKHIQSDPSDAKSEGTSLANLSESTDRLDIGDDNSIQARTSTSPSIDEPVQDPTIQEPAVLIGAVRRNPDLKDQTGLSSDKILESLSGSTTTERVNSKAGKPSQATLAEATTLWPSTPRDDLTSESGTATEPVVTEKTGDQLVHVGAVKLYPDVKEGTSVPTSQSVEETTVDHEESRRDEDDDIDNNNNNNNSSEHDRHDDTHHVHAGVDDKGDDSENVEVHIHPHEHPHSENDTDGDALVTSVMSEPKLRSTTTRIPTLEEVEARWLEEHGPEDDTGSGSVHDEHSGGHTDTDKMTKKTDHEHSDEGHDDGEVDASSVHHKDTPEDKESKKRTAIIVGVAIGGVAIFTLAFFTSRWVKNKKDFKVMKKVNKGDGGEEAIEFRPLNQSPTGIYDQIDGSGRVTNGLYRQGPKMGPPSPRFYRKNEGRFEFPEIYTVPAKPKKTDETERVPPTQSSTSVSASAPPPAAEPLINGVDQQLKYIDDSTDDEGVNSVRERLLPSSTHDPSLSRLPEETPPKSPASPASSFKLSPAPKKSSLKKRTGDSDTQKSMPKTDPPTSDSSNSQGSLAAEIVDRLSKTFTRQDGGEDVEDGGNNGDSAKRKEGVADSTEDINV